ncbi:MAG: pyrroloquinoline-quinone synthase [Candidatus Midichloriaceae bacterium]|jgi:pyrroloquinoline-quinone synthase
MLFYSYSKFNSVILMNDFVHTLKKSINPFHLLKHPFYKDWNAGKLNLEVLQEYSKQYFHHVDAFPRCISSIHSNCTDLKNRQVLLGNLLEEEDKENSHPDLWLKFAKGLNISEEEVKNVDLNKETEGLINDFLAISRSSYASGLGALYAYEYQMPEVAKSKIKGLKAFYNITNKDTTEFFTVHIEADEWHSEECLDLLKKLNSKEEQDAAIEGATKLAKLMWKFLDGVERETKHLC